jgi:GT2 family glycosyltransferase/ubiquinone/menaquinone biosynthesis C-methylase UbiE
MIFPKVSIIILNWNQLAFLQQCLKSIIENTNYANFEIIILDNGSREEGTVDYLNSLPFKIILNPKNLGYARGNNLAAKKAEGDLLVFLNNDIIAEKNWLTPMVKLMLERVDCGIVGSKLLYPDRTIQHVGVAFDWRGNRRHIYKKYPADISPALEVRECEAVTGACLMIRRELFEQVGGFDERYKNGSEDIDLCLKVRAQGYCILFCPQSVLIHFEKTSLKNKGNFYQKWSSKLNNWHFRKKWGKKLDQFRLIGMYEGLRPIHYYNQARLDLLPLVPQEAKVILDIGCGRGLMGKALKERNNSITVWGIEIDSEAAQEAQKNLDYCLVADLEKLVENGLNLPQFDCIIFADILEHLRDPWSVLKRFATYLHSSGRIVCSLPNIRHYKIIKDILRDRWQYREEGILDETHLRFFSLASIKRIFALGGYEIDLIKRKKKASNFMKWLNFFFFKLLDDFLTQQYLIVAHKKNEPKIKY